MLVWYLFVEKCFCQLIIMTFAFANKMLCMCCLLQRYKLQSKFKPFVMYTPCRYRIEQELGTEIKPIPPIIEKDLYCS